MDLRGEGSRKDHKPGEEAASAEPESAVGEEKREALSLRAEKE